MTLLAEIMTPAVKAVKAEATLKELAEFFMDEDVSGAPVVSSGKLVGVVSVTDLIEFEADDRGTPTYESVAVSTDAEDGWTPTERSAAYFFDPRDDDRVPLQARLATTGALWNSLEEYTVEDVMTRQLLTLPSHAEMTEGARAMIGAGVHRLLIMDGDALVGVVTTTDIVRAVATHGLEGLSG
ncbi:MAG: CBS domain-containing protein [Gemmatimonadota bacterium]